MSRLAFDYGVRARSSRLRIVPFWLHSTDINQGYVPNRTFVYSVLFHAILLGGLIFVPIYISSTQIPLPQIRVTTINLKDPNYRLYLPVLLGAEPTESEVPELPKEELNKPAPQPRKPSTNPIKGFSYPGPQPIVSNLPKPTNIIQTLLQPALIDPPTLPPPIALPNMVQMPVAAPPRLAASNLPNAFAPPEPPPPAPVAPAVKTIEMPLNAPIPIVKKPVLPIGAAQNAPDMPLPQPPPPTIAPVPAPQTPTAKDIQSPAINAMQALLALSPTPAPPADNVKIPAGEARGRFAISPQPNLTTETEPGSKTEPVVTATKGKDSVAAPDSGNSSPSGTDISKRGNAFPGITILESGAAPVPISITGAPAPVQTSYGIMLLSTEHSGGGLPRFGVFSLNEQIYTVFIDMRRTSNDPALSWTLEYAVLKGPAAPATQTNSAAGPDRNLQGLVAPFPIAKEPPALPAELVRKYPRRQIIVYAVINIEGKMEQIAVKDSPDPLLNEHVLNALRKWSFRPAKLGGENVAVKALMGIPLVSSQ